MLPDITLHSGQQVPHLEQYFGCWAMHQDQLAAQWQWASKLSLNVHLQSPQAQSAREVGVADGSKPMVTDGIAIIGLAGTLMKHQSSYGSSTSTVLARRKIRSALNNSDVHGILLVVESPGGTVSGTKELADEVAAANKIKPVWAYCEDLCASAAYWIASQAEKVYANPTAILGSIGTYMVIYDSSLAAEREGIKVHVVRAGEMKGAGTPGTAISEKLLGEWQLQVNAMNEFFVAGFAAGRRMTIDQARKLADGRVYVGKAAQNVGLIDGVHTLDETWLGFRARAIPNQPRAALPVVPATIAELRVACIGADDSFLLAQVEARATVEQARAAWDPQRQAAKEHEELMQRRRIRKGSY